MRAAVVLSWVPRLHIGQRLPVQSWLLAILLAGALEGSPAAENRQEDHSGGGLTNYVQKIPGTTAAFEMIAIPGGTITPGRSKDSPQDTNDLPARPLTVKPFWIGRYEVTWDEFLPYIFAEWDKAERNPEESDGFSRPTKPYGSLFREHGQARHPALGMSHYSAVQFCRWLRARTGLEYRLPTEAEWEYACRAGTNTVYCWGDNPDLASEHAWFEANSDMTTHPVGKKPPNKFGVYDMVGNIAEWCAEDSEEAPRVARGGAFTEPLSKLRCAARMMDVPEWNALDPQIPKSMWWLSSADFVGIRVVRSLPEPTEAEENAGETK